MSEVQPSVDGARGPVHRTPIEIEWGHCDAASIVFYPNYMRWFTISTHALLRAGGIDLEHLKQRYDAIGLPVVDVQVNFQAPATFGERIIVASTLLDVSNRSFVVHHRVLKEEKVICEGREKRVMAAWADRTALELRSLPLPDDFRTRLAPFISG